LKITQHYLKSKHTVISTKLFRQSKKMIIRESLNELDKLKQTNAIILNIIHSLDATHLINLINKSQDIGFAPIITVHDCFGTHSCLCDFYFYSSSLCESYFYSSSLCESTSRGNKNKKATSRGNKNKKVTSRGLNKIDKLAFMASARSPSARTLAEARVAEARVKREFVLLYSQDNFLKTYHDRLIQSIKDNKYKIIFNEEDNANYVINNDYLIKIPNIPKLASARSLFIFISSARSLFILISSARRLAEEIKIRLAEARGKLDLQKIIDSKYMIS
jgi:DNA-directed RNA polymerase